MMKILSYFTMAILTFWALSFEFKGKTIFSHIDQNTSVVTRPVQKALTEGLQYIYTTSAHWFGKLFKNSMPTTLNSSSIKELQGTKAPQENISDHDRAELESLIRKSH